MKLNDNKTSQLMIRIGLGIFFFIFGLLKLTQSDWFANNAYKMFYGTVFSTTLIMIIGILQVLIAISFFVNKYTKWSAWIASVFLLSTIIATMPKLLTTFQLPPAAAPPGFLFVAAIPLLFMALSQALKEE
ncbi:DoxX family membrane protein [Candidatus Woesearchaeota archaeon]|jgi:uncharacterized membrane protein YphA (DoxX/SURF4 family)|nr:DoxX family membrane protein [Candidatus Woesearchaeota archaeon]MBT4387887.1 DoxX family membrane protein [Candidatus Woesearchaeota archaeon]MBT4595706.1 DoxX family membrane protein [Candidatus Woesearchaeota archaeon]MBT5741445.1 DoxX family membrane protein [Candidatus Woesearchaeota archaeon]MBT6505886.1 DoxX family membrane protein [Candidatus Woesearchaeota archaeon]